MLSILTYISMNSGIRWGVRLPRCCCYCASSVKTVFLFLCPSFAWVWCWECNCETLRFLLLLWEVCRTDLAFLDCCLLGLTLLRSAFNPLPRFSWEGLLEQESEGPLLWLRRNIFVPALFYRRFFSCTIRLNLSNMPCYDLTRFSDFCEALETAWNWVANECSSGS